MKWKNKKVGLSLLVTVILLSSLLSYQLGSSSVPASGPWKLHVPFSDASYYVAKFDNGTTYMVDADTWKCTWWSTNSSAIINACIGNSTDGNSIFFKDETFTIDATITDHDQDNIIIQGSGKYSTIFKLANDANDHVFEITNVTGWTFRDFQVDGNKAQQSSGDLIGISLGYTTNCLLENLYVHHVYGDDITHGRGIQIVDSDDIDVIDCESSYNYKAGFHIGTNVTNSHFIRPTAIENGVEGLVLYGSVTEKVEYCKVLDGYFFGNGVDSPASANAIDLYQWADYNHVIGNTVIVGNIEGYGNPIGVGHDGDKPSNHNIIANNILLCSNYAIRGIRVLGNSSGNTLIANEIYDWAENGHGIEITGSVTNDNHCIGNTIISSNAGTRGIYFRNDGVGGEAIGNFINVTAYGIDVDMDDISVVDNTIKTANVGVYVTDGDDCMIKNNRFRGVTTPIDCNRVDAVRPMIMGNNWEGCTNNATTAGATDERITSNIDTTGAWWATGDDPS